MLFIRLSLAFWAFATSAESAFIATRDVYYLLYTKNNPSGENVSVNSVSSNFNPLNPTRIFIHGWQNHHNSPIPTGIKKAYLDNSGNFNVILVDWSALALNLNYDTVRKACGSVADELAKLLRFLVDQNLTSLGTLVMSGHSLGAHIAGFVGKQVPNVYAIVGLDPAGLGYSQSNSSSRLSSTDATIVQVIHTTSTSGAWYTIGTSDFFMNNAICQPGCLFCDLSCSHGRSAEYFAESINSSRFKVRGTYMGGEPLATNATGNYNLSTNSESLFAKG